MHESSPVFHARGELVKVGILIPCFSGAIRLSPSLLSLISYVSHVANPRHSKATNSEIVEMNRSQSSLIAIRLVSRKVTSSRLIYVLLIDTGTLHLYSYQNKCPSPDLFASCPQL